MTLGSIIGIVRSILDDEAGVDDSSRLWKDVELTEYANDAVRILCQKAHLIEDDETINEVLASGTITLSGISGSVDSVKVNGVTITSGPVPFDTNLTTTAANLAANINAYTSDPDYTATSVGAVVTIKAKAGTGSTPNGYIVEVQTTTLVATCTNMSGGSALTRLYLVLNQSIYQLHSKILLINRAKLSNQPNPLIKKTRAEMDEMWSDWENATGDPIYFIPLIKQKRIIFVPKPISKDTCILNVSRLPITELSSGVLTGIPEIPEEYHINTVNWILHRSYMKNDADTLRLDKAAVYEKKFLLEDVEDIKRIEINREAREGIVKPIGAFT